MTRDRNVREIPVLRPLLPAAAQLLPYLSRIDSGRCYTNWGPLASELERRLADGFGLSGHGVVSANSGTAALIGAILATAGRATVERPVAILPALTFVATAVAVEQCGFRVHLADVSPEDWMLDATVLLNHPLLGRTGLIVPVAAYGRPLAAEPWEAFKKTTGIPIVIDGAASFEAIGSGDQGAPSEIPVALSFHATKAFASGEGGCVVTSDTGLAESVTRALNFGFFEDRQSRAASTNGKMSEYHAAVGLAELDGWPVKRQSLLSVAVTYAAQMRDAGLARRLVTAPEVASCYVLFRSQDVHESSSVKTALTAGGVGFRSWYGDGVHSQPHFHNVSRDALDVTDHLAPLLIGLPVAPDLTAADVARVVAALEAGISRSR